MMITYRSVLLSLLMMFGLTSCDSSNKTDLPKMPYESWRLGGRYPPYFRATILDSYGKSQSGGGLGASLSLAPNNSSKDPANWEAPRGWPDAMYAAGDLPEEIYVCWASYVDQAIYKTKIVVPLEIRKQMVVPHIVEYHVPDSDKIEIYTRYLDTIILGFGPGGNVIAWLNGVSLKDGIAFATGETYRLPPDSKECHNPYRHGKIPEVKDEVKAWLKKHGMPKHWQEKPSVYETPSWKQYALK